MQNTQTTVKGLEWILEGDKFGFGEGWAESDLPECEEEEAGYNIVRAIEFLKSLPEIVRCEHCRWGRPVEGTSLITCVDKNVHPKDWFCADGEERDTYD